MDLNPEFVGVAGAWALRELVAYLRAQRQVTNAVPSRVTATDSGNFPAVTLDGLATRREVDALAQVVRELQASVVELSKVIAVLKDRANIAD